MAKYRNKLSELSRNFFITPGGLETHLIYKENVSIPCFATFTLLNDESKRELIKNYLKKFVNIAKKYHCGIILQGLTWRANPDWIKKLNYKDEDIIDINKKSIELFDEIRNEYSNEDIPILINGSIGPRSDGYYPSSIMSAEQSYQYHSKQIQILSQTNVDMLTAFTLTYPNEAIGIVKAAKQFNTPIVISFTVENNGRLITGQTIKEAIQIVDDATSNGPIFYMINCAHPSHFQHIFDTNEEWILRIHGIKGNSSKKSHKELDQSTELDSGNPIEFSEDNLKLLYKLKNLHIIGGCCGTDFQHAEEISKVCLPKFNQIKDNKDH